MSRPPEGYLGHNTARTHHLHFVFVRGLHSEEPDEVPHQEGKERRELSETRHYLHMLLGETPACFHAGCQTHTQPVFYGANKEWNQLTRVSISASSCPFAQSTPALLRRTSEFDGAVRRKAGP